MAADERSPENERKFYVMRHAPREDIKNYSLFKLDPGIDVASIPKILKSYDRLVDHFFKPDLIFVSPYARTIETADVILRERGVSYVIVPEFGDCRHVEHTILNIRKSTLDFLDNTGPELYSDFQKRVIKKYKELKKLKINILIITHRSVSTCLQMYVNKEMKRTDYCSFVRLNDE